MKGKIDRTPAKPTAHHASAKDIVRPVRIVDEEIEFGATNLIVITKAGVTVIEQLTQPIPVLLFKGRNGLADALMFTLYKQNTPEQYRR
jgi:hypothetical protein